MESTLQKIIVVIVGLVMSVVGALSPDLLASRTQNDAPSLSANTAEETLTTLRTSDGQAFARISVLWVEVDGRRVTEDAWGTGEVDEIRFKVGVKSVDDVALAVGDKIIELHPTDIITVRMFRGDFSYRGLGTTLSSVQLQGTVKTTVLNEGDITHRVLTRAGDFDLPSHAPGGESKVAYVVLTTGEKVDTVAVEDGGARLFTEDAATAAEAKNEPGNLLAKWVKIDGKLVREYTWGDGPLKKIEFEPAETFSRSVVLAFNGETTEVQAGERVVVEEFVGEYLVYQVSGGMLRVRLDGYASASTTGMAAPVPSVGGEGAPVANFDVAPASPKTTDTVQFRDRSNDDGIIVFRQWDFDDQTPISVLQDPTHRFARPGTYDVTLNVTDNDLKSSSITIPVIVRNAEPIADFDFSPKVVTTSTVVTFTDQSFDSDGSVVNRTWDFGDGNLSTDRHPSYTFSRGGNATVTLTVVDDLGMRTSLSKVVIVRNAPPMAGFTFSPAAPDTLDPVQFIDNSSDRDGSVVAWNWSFGDGSFGAGSSPVHAYKRPGLYTVSLTAYDDGGDADTVSTTILIGNRAPFADFTWDPDGQPRDVPVRFSSASSDPDGVILLHDWSFGDGSRGTRGVAPTHTFPRAGVYNVTLRVTDNTLGVSNVTKSVSVANSAPRADFFIAYSPTFRGVEITVSDMSVDVDGDPIVNWTWDMGDGATRFDRTVRHTYNSVGSFTITLTIRDANDATSFASREVRVLNRPPTILADWGPRPIAAGEVAIFSAQGIDPDLPGGSVAFDWSFSDGVKLTGEVVTRNFSRPGNFTVRVTARDSEGGVSSPVVLGITVTHAKPAVNFSWSPVVPVPNQLVQFTSNVSLPNGPIKEWKWNFGVDARSVSNLPNPTFVYAKNGTYQVTLEVTDVANQTNVTVKKIVINLLPQVRFTAPTEVLQLGAPVQFTDASFDDDGEVVNWSWELGDGTTSFERHPTHPGYEAPGVYPVNLTIRDDRGATNRSSKTLDVANRAPVAKWEYTTGGLPQERGVPITFRGGALSEDPDGQPLTSFDWDFGDGSLHSELPNVTHAFARSGLYTVGLTVGDGLKLSARTPESHQRLRIGANHSVMIAVTATLPDGSPADLSTGFTLKARIGSVQIGADKIVPNVTGFDVTIDQELWLNGTTVGLTLTSPTLIGRNEQGVQLRDGVLHVPIVFRLRMGVLAEIQPYGGVNDPILMSLLGRSSNFSGEPIYHDMFEKPRGTGRLRYTDLSPVASSRVDIEARWVPLKALLVVRDPIESPDNTNSIIGWCKVDETTTAQNGTFEWAFDGTSPCYTNSLVGGVYPVGRWEVRARSLVTTAENSISPVKVFYVDPTGGVLLGALGGLA